MNKIRELSTRLLPEGQTIKVIRGKAYLYQQEYGRTQFLGPATDEQVDNFKNAGLIKWLIKNEEKFVKGLLYLQGLRRGTAE